MSQEIRRRFQATCQYSANNKVSEPLSRGMIMRHLMLRLRGTITTSAGGDNDAADVQKAGEWGVIQRIDVIANGSDVIKSISGEQLWWLNYFLFGSAPRESAAIGAGGDDPAFDSVLLLPFWIPRSVRPFDTALDARRLSDLKIEVTWGDQNDILTPAGASAFAVAPTLDVYSLESFNVPTNAAFSQWRQFIIEKEVTAANSQLRIELPVSHLYRGFLINTFGGATVAAFADIATILNNVKLISGTTVFADIPANILRDEYRIMNDMDIAVTRKSTLSSVNGWYMLDMVTDGRLSEAIDTLGYAEFTLELDVAHPSTIDKIRIIPSQIIPVRG